jgi:integrase
MKASTDSASKRSRLAARRNPYWEPCGPQRGGLSLGYRKAERGPGSWIGRFIENKQRFEARLGEADDAGAGGMALPYAAAVTAAMSWAGRVRLQASGRSAGSEAPTLQSAIDVYVARRKQRGARNGRDAETRLKRHVLSVARVALKKLPEVSEKDLSDLVRGLKGLSPSSVTRLVSDLKAALNEAWTEHHALLPPTWREGVERALKVRPSPGATEASHHRPAITDADMRRLVEAAFQVDSEGDFGRLVAVLAATGARLSQVGRLRIADVQAGEEPRLMVPTSAKGRPGSRKPSHHPVPVGVDLVALLQPAIAGRKGSDLLLMKWRMQQVPGDKSAGIPPMWRRDTRVGWLSAADLTRPWRKALSQAGLPPELTPYRLRDASVIRGLRVGLPVRLVAQLHDTSAAMIEKHYASYIVDALSEVERRAIVPIRPAAVGKMRVVAS